MRRACGFLVALWAVAPLAVALNVPTQKRDLPEKSGPRVEPVPELHLPEDPEPFTGNPTGAGLEVNGLEQALVPYSFLQFTFPEPMVDAGEVDVPADESPVIFWPDLDVEFVWRTPTTGDLFVRGPIIPGQIYRLRLRAGLSDMEGRPLPVEEWGATLQSPALTVTDFSAPGTPVAARPTVRATLNYPVDLADAAQRVWFQDRASRERFPAEVFVNEPAAATPSDTIRDLPGPPPGNISSLRFRPVAPLPADRTFDFVIDGLRDAYAGRVLPYPAVIPLGKTSRPSVEFVAARSLPLEKPQIVIKFSRNLNESDPLPPDALRVTPPVGDMSVRVSGSELIAEGSFAVPGRYEVTISDKIPSANGYTLPAPEKWGATFRGKRPGVIFPDRLIRLRAANGLRFSFYQVNTGPLEWKLATIPEDRLPDIQRRLHEFEPTPRGPDAGLLRDEDGYFLDSPTRALIGEEGLAVIASGRIEGAEGNEEILREIAWKPEDPANLGGAALLEVTGQDKRGRLVGNRAIVYFGHLALTRKADRAGITIRAAQLDDASPANETRVGLVDADGLGFMEATTGAEGIARFEDIKSRAAEGVVAEWAGTRTDQPFSLSSPFPGGYTGWTPPPALRAYAFTDRPLYRPGQTVHFKGFLRKAGGDGLSPTRGTIHWEIRRLYAREVYASGSAEINESGAWHGKWTSPEDGPVGAFELEARMGKSPVGNAVVFQVEEIRNPPFSVVCETPQPGRPAEASLVVDSRYFHGAANAGARVLWKATWLADTDDGYPFLFDEHGMNRTDLHGPGAHRPTFEASAAGEARLDNSGRVILRCESPFEDSANRARSEVIWRVDVTGPDGRTVTAGASQIIPMQKSLPGVKSLEPGPMRARFAWDVESPFGSPADGASAELFRVVTKSVRERLAPGVYRFRNFDEFQPVATTALEAPGEFEFEVREPGRYVVAIDPIDDSAALRVSAETYIVGEGAAELPIDSEYEARVLPLNPDKQGPDAAWKIGETARIGILAPTAGVAWVTVETDRILDSFTVPLSGNAAEIEIPVKPEYEPNAYVAVYLLRPGGMEGLAGEMFGTMEMRVRDPARELDINFDLAKSRIEPRETVTGSVRVTADGKPVPGADLAIYAVDDALLTAGGWSLPRDIAENFFPRRQHGVVTYSALDGYVDGIRQDWLTRKGFVVGGGGESEFSNADFVRKNFHPMMLWLPSVETGPDGTARFEATAPDNTGRFRFVVIGQSAMNQFGAADATIEVAKSLMVEPALPRFVRVGDRLSLRALIRQDALPEAGVAVNCSLTGPGLLKDATQQVTSTRRDIPEVIHFDAQADGTGTLGATFTAETRDADGKPLRDAVEISVPVLPAAYPLRQAVVGTWKGSQWTPSEEVPDDWPGRAGTFSATLSTSPDFGQVQAAQMILSYPHGCLEQQSSKLLVLTHLRTLLDSLPVDTATTAPMESTVSEVLGTMESALLPSGFLPYWPGGTLPDPFVTIQTAWCVFAAEAAGIPVPPHLATTLPEACRSILENRAAGTPPTLRALALFVLASQKPSDTAPLVAAAADLFAIRDKLTPEARAWIVLALAKLDANPDMISRLLADLPPTAESTTFTPATFSSPPREHALILWARIAGDPRDKEARVKLEELLRQSDSLTTQENLWLLLAFADIQSSRPAPRLPSNLRPAPDRLSADHTSAAWLNRPLEEFPDFRITGLAGRRTGSWLLQAAIEPDSPLTAPVDNGIRIERVIKNLTEPTRTGSANSPVKVGDELLVSFRMSTDKPHAFVALSAPMPAALETLNPDVAMFAGLAPSEDLGNALAPSHTAIRDASTTLYFNQFPANSSSTAILTRATTAGKFTWPASEVSPMYKPLITGQTAATEINIVP